MPYSHTHLSITKNVWFLWGMNIDGTYKDLKRHTVKTFYIIFIHFRGDREILFRVQNVCSVNWVVVSCDSLTRYTSSTKSRSCHNYCSPLPLDATYFENCYPTKKKIVCSAVLKDRISNSNAQCISRTISHWTTSVCWFFWAALEASPDTIHICTRQRRWTGALDCKTTLFLLDCLVLGLNGYSGR